MDTYIHLERRFAPYTAGVDRDSLGMYASSEFYARLTWKDILKHRCTVIIGAGGTGKTRELRQQVVSLRAQGKAAFFCRLEDLASLPLASALEEGTPQELETWLRAADEGWFFLDAVNEAKLVNVRHFEMAIRKFLEVTAPHLPRAHIVISTRPHAWEAYGDLAMLCEKLNLRVLAPGEGERSLPDNDDTAQAPTVDTTSGQHADTALNPLPDKQEPLHTVTLASLSAADVRTFALALGVEVADMQPFMDEVEQSNADLYVSRPADLPGIVDIWKKTRKIGSYSNVVLHNITIKLKDLNPRYQQVATLTPERALRGAERLAAAATLSRRSSFLLPDRSPLEAKVRDELLDPKDILLDWRPAEVQELLGRALFDESLYGSVRFHHSTAREYLTARWLRRLLGLHKHRRAVKDLLFARPYGTENPVVVPSLKPVAGWLALWDQDIRNSVLRVAPKVLLEFGDASRLPVDIRASMLRGFTARYASQSQIPLRLDRRELRRLADDRLLPAITDLLGQYRQHQDIRDLLLDLVLVGKIRGSASLALSFALDGAIDAPSRATAIEIVGVAGSDDDKRRLKDALLRTPLIDRHLLATLIKVLYRSHLDMSEIAALVEAAQLDDDSGYTLQHTLLKIIEKAPDDADRLRLLTPLVALLERPPFAQPYCRISSGYAWLLPAAFAAAKVCLANHPEGPFDPSVIAAVYMASQASRLRIFTADTNKDATALLFSNRPLKHAVFWHAVDREHEARPGDPNSSSYRAIHAIFSHRPMPMDEGDVDHLRTALADTTNPDHRPVALRALVEIYVYLGQPAQLLAEIRAAAAGADHLETQLDSYLNPPPPNEEHQAINERIRQMDEQDAAEEGERRRRRQEGTAWLRANVPSLSIGDYAREGRVLTNIRYLHQELAGLDKRSSSRWTLARWRLLEPEFGPEVARAYRDHCVAYWRMYRPRVHSETEGDTNSTPWSVILGLSGLAIEAAEEPRWPHNLSAEEAALATRYALLELNDLPSWFTRLFAAHPDSVKAVLLQEMVWELTQPRRPNTPGYVFARLRWSTTQLGTDLRDDVLQLLHDHPVAGPAALTEALTLILRNPAPIPSSFSEILTQRIAAAGSDEVKALWLAGFLCTDAPRGLPMLEDWINSAGDRPSQERRLSTVLRHVWGDKFHGLNPEHQSYRRADIVLPLIELAHAHVNPADDASVDDLADDEEYIPELRDHAEAARDRLVNILYELPGPESHRALLALSDFHSDPYPKARMLVLAEQRAETDTEHREWLPEEVDAFAAEAERTPRTQEDLFKLALSRLDDVKLDLEDGDESEASLLRRVKNEVELRKVIANRLRFSAAGKYTTGSEEELANAKRTDIRLHHPEVGARIPIELKIADARHWSAVKLRKKLEEQLADQYLREARYGIFLLVRCGRRGDRPDWPHPALNTTFDFAGLTAWLQEEARELLRSNPSIDGLEVVGIDLTRRDR